MGVDEISDEELLKRAVRACRSYRTILKTHPRWVAVQDNFGLGATYSHELCRRFGFDPDENVSR